MNSSDLPMQKNHIPAKTRIMRLIASLLIGVIIAGCQAAAEIRADVPAVSKPYLLHLPGIAGIKSIDRSVNRGIVDGGFTGNIENYDWTENDPGIGALVAYQRNHKEAQLIADKIAQERAGRVGGQMYILAHSGGCGLAVWALEYLPADVKIDTLVLMSPALSPGYDLTAALKHVTGRVYVFSSLADLFVLGTGTRLFGTIDGVKTDAAGRVGFTKPPNGDAKQYEKLVPMPYDTAWFKYNDRGDHIGGMTRSFGEHVLEPLLVRGQMPATSMPTTMETPTGLGRELPR